MELAFRVWRCYTCSTIFQQTVFNQTNKDLHHLVKDNIVSGPAIIFHRYHEKNVTKIRAGETCRSVVGYEANAPYVWALMQDMPWVVHASMWNETVPTTTNPAVWTDGCAMVNVGVVYDRSHHPPSKQRSWKKKRGRSAKQTRVKLDETVVMARTSAEHSCGKSSAAKRARHTKPMLTTTTDAKAVPSKRCKRETVVGLQ